MNQDEYKSRVGLDSLYVAEVTQDDASGYAAGTPEWFAPAAEASMAPAVNRSTQYADDQAYDAHSSEGETTIQLTVTGIPLEMLAKITGRVYDAATGRMFDNAGTPPEYALMFRSQKSNGGYRYYSYLKGKFDMPGEEAASKTDSPDPKTTQVTFTAVKTIYKFDLGSIDDGVKRVVGDTDATNFSATGFFLQVQTPATTTPDALALSSSTPADAATGVSVSANLTLTFNNAMVDGTPNNVTLIKASDGSVVAGSKTLDATKKIVTIDPTASLSASTDYILVYAVTDIYGQTLAGAVNFTTA